MIKTKFKKSQTKEDKQTRELEQSSNSQSTSQLSKNIHSGRISKRERQNESFQRSPPEPKQSSQDQCRKEINDPLPRTNKVEKVQGEQAPPTEKSLEGDQS